MSSMRVTKLHIPTVVKKILFVFCISSPKSQNGIELGPVDNGRHKDKVEFRKKGHGRSQSHTNRLSYLEAVSWYC